MSRIVRENMTGGEWVAALRKNPTLAGKCEWKTLTPDDWLYLLGHCPNNGDIVSRCDKWELFPVDRVCDLLARASAARWSDNDETL